MPPGSPPHWMGVKMAHEFGPVCPQNVPDPNSRKMSESRAMYLRRLVPFLHNQSEDCLFLNIYAPAQNREYKDDIRENGLCPKETTACL
ncbi:neuroligin-1-like [Zootermopsis nevadensis]|uniref:neuroligin-1-like n=1 Tax=Zootermopsis nevadensis TaxID=136037 RepID=UPI000B8E8815|nr:neuroligin-1-like [Zootermopsis nevadensis]